MQEEQEASSTSSSAGTSHSDQPTAEPEVKKLYRYQSRRPAEVEAASGSKQEYQHWRESTSLREPYRVPIDFLKGTKPFAGLNLAEAPLICFINSKSGGQAGPLVTLKLSQAISYSQVFDVSQTRPAAVLQCLYANLQQAANRRDAGALHILQNLCILVCGGDGTAAWVLKTIHDLKIQPAPYVAICPLGTGNDLSLSFGWGNAFESKWFKGHREIYQTLARVAAANHIDLDCWKATLTVPSDDYFERLPHSMDRLGNGQVTSPWWNYLSFGIDAEAAWGFAHLRETKPQLAKRRGANMAWYAYYSCSTGWFCPGAYAIQDRLRVQLKARKPDGEYENIKVSHGISAVVLLNLQSYGGGRDLWGLDSNDSDRHTKRSFSTPIFNDGRFEVVGLRSGWHTALVMGKFNRHLHATRLAQTDSIIMTAGASGEDDEHAYLQLDGEPWPQRVPGAGKEPLKLEVTFDSKSHMLFNTQYILGQRSVRKLVKRSARLSQLEVPDEPLPSFLKGLLPMKTGKYAAKVPVEHTTRSRTSTNPYATRSQGYSSQAGDSQLEGQGSTGHALESVDETQ